MASMLTCYAEKNAPATPSSLIKLKKHNPAPTGAERRYEPFESGGVLHCARRCTTSGGCRFCTDRSRAETSNVRVRQDSFIYKRYPFRIPFVYKKSARRDSNPRPRPWQGRTLPTEPLSHSLYCSVCFLCSLEQYILYRIIRLLSTAFFNFFQNF